MEEFYLKDTYFWLVVNCILIVLQEYEFDLNMQEYRIVSIISKNIIEGFKIEGVLVVMKLKGILLEILI